MTTEKDHVIIRLDQVSKQFGPDPVLHDISWEIPQGHIAGLVGLNGAGKTTLLRLLMGIVKPTAGRGKIANYDLYTQRQWIRQLMGYVAEKSSIPPTFTTDSLECLGRQVFPRWDHEIYRNTLKHFSIRHDRPVYLMSQGQRVLMALAFALAHHAEILLLDEPTNGLDPLVRRDFLNELIEESYDQGRTVILSSHRLDEIEHVAQDIAILHQGSLVDAGPMEALCESDRIVSFRVERNITDRQLAELPGASQVALAQNQASCYVVGYDEPHFSAMLRSWGISQWTSHVVSLEQLFRERVGDRVV